MAIQHAAVPLVSTWAGGTRRRHVGRRSTRRMPPGGPGVAARCRQRPIAGGAGFATCRDDRGCAGTTGRNQEGTPLTVPRAGRPDITQTGDSHPEQPIRHANRHLGRRLRVGPCPVRAVGGLTASGRLVLMDGAMVFGIVAVARRVGARLEAERDGQTDDPPQEPGSAVHHGSSRRQPPRRPSPTARDLGS